MTRQADHVVILPKQALFLRSAYLCVQGLGAPAGSIVAGPKPFIHRVHKLRKMLGGGMRQVGVLAAPGQQTFCPLSMMFLHVCTMRGVMLLSSGVEL